MSNNEVTIVAIVVTHNRIEKLRRTISSLLSESVNKIIVVDNASTDGTSEWLSKTRESKIFFVTNSDNLGGAGGFAMALEMARDHFPSDWVVVMDDDGRPQPGSIAKFRKMDHGEWDAIGAAVFYPDGKICEMNRPYINPFWNLKTFLRTLIRLPIGGGRYAFHLDDSAYDLGGPTRPIDMSSFVGLFLSRRAIIKSSPPDPRLFIYGDDQIYTLKMRRQGLRIGFCPQIRFEHDTISLQGEERLSLRPIWKVYYMYRNALIAYRIAAGPFFFLLVPVLLKKWRAKSVYYAAEASLFRVILHQAVRDGLSGNLERSHQEILQIASASTPRSASSV